DAVRGDRADAAPTEAVEPEHREDRGRLHLEGQDAGALQIGHERLAPALGVAAPAGSPLAGIEGRGGGGHTEVITHAEPLGGLYPRQHDQVVSGRRVLDLHVLRAGAVQAYGGGVDHDVAALDLALDGAAGPHADERVSPDGDELFERAGGGPTTGA